MLLPKKLFLNLLFIFLFSQIIYPQLNNLKFDTIGLEQGLSQSTVYTITQDKLGFMWFGTQDGLNRYDGYSIEVYKHNMNDTNSISDNTIWSSLCDSEGDLWFGTMRGGLCRYNITDNKFLKYSLKSSKNSRISSNTVLSLMEDSDRNIWIGTNHGVDLINRKSGKITQFKFYSENLSLMIENLSVWSMSEDRNKTLWIGTSRGLFKLKLNETYENLELQQINTLNEEANFKDLVNSHILSTHIDQYGNLWIGTLRNGVYKYSISKSRIKHFLHDPRDSKTISGNSIRSIIEDLKGNIWLACYDGGMNLFDSTNETFINYDNIALLTLFEDRTGIKWIGTLEFGVKSFDALRNQFNHIKIKQENIANPDINLITSIIESRENEIWVGTHGSGLVRYYSQRNKVKIYKFNPQNNFSISNNNIYAICETSDGNIWIGTNGGLNLYDRNADQFIRYEHQFSKKNAIGLNQIVSLYEDKKGNLWIGNAAGGIDILNLKTKKFTRFIPNEKDINSLPGGAIYFIYESRHSGILVSTYQGGLYQFMPEKNSFIRFIHNSKLFNGSDEGTIVSIYEDGSGTMWFGTYGGGLIRYDPQKINFKNYNENNGLPNNVIYSILPDNLGNLWLSTNKGLSRFSTVKETFTNFDLTDGLQSNEFNQGSFFKSTSGELYFGGSNGFNSFFPENIKENEAIPPVYVTSIKVFDKLIQTSKSISSLKQLEISYFQNYITFEFVALNYTAPLKNLYAYILEGFDKDWHYITSSNRRASYTNLDPGTYTLRIKASNNSGIWNSVGTSIKIIVVPPFWMTWWFKGLISILILLFISSSVRYFVKKRIEERTKQNAQLIALEKERLRIARDIHDDLGSRLTEVRLQCELAKNDFGDEVLIVLNNISESVKNIILTMSEIVWSLNPKNDTLENLAGYLSQYAIEFLSNAKIRCRLDILDEFPKITVNSITRHNILLSFKESLNNAVKYSETESILVSISLYSDYQKKNIIITIRDYGKGFNLDDESKWGQGIKSISDRIKSIGGSLSMQSKDGYGTTLIMVVPFTN